MLMKTSIPKQLLHLDKVSARLGQQVFGPFSLNVIVGEKLAILGPSGAGKSTLLKLMSRELSPVDGHITFNSRAITARTLQELSEQRAVLPQKNDVAFGLQTDLVIGLGRVARSQDQGLDRIVSEAATLAHASHLLGRRFDNLSGGEQARVQLARVFAQLWNTKDGLILVDEPLAALDPGLQFDLLDSIEHYASERHHAVIAILHDINHAIQSFDRLLLVKDGSLHGDMPADQMAIPALETLYGIRLNCYTRENGDLLVSPVRKPSRLRTLS